MTEREIHFSEGESREIAIQAREAAGIGEDFVWTLVHVKFELMKIALKGGPNGVIIENTYYTPNQMKHEVDVVEEIVRQARLILQFEGIDSASELDRHAEEAGWGSIFDRESEAYKRFGYLLD